MFCLQGDLGSVADVGWWYQEVGRQVGVVIQSRGPGLFTTGSELRVWVQWSCTGFVAISAAQSETLHGSTLNRQAFHLCLSKHAATCFILTSGLYVAPTRPGHSLSRLVCA